MPAGQSPKKTVVLPKVFKKCIRDKKKKKKKVFSCFLIHLIRKAMAGGGISAAVQQE